MNTTTLSGSSSAKGRNGYFRVASIRPETPITVELSSRREADTPPLVMDLTPDDARALVEAVQSALIDLSLAEQYPEYAERLAAGGTLGADHCYKCADTPPANRTPYGHLELDRSGATVLVRHVRAFEARFDGRCRWCARELADHDQRHDLPGAPALCLA